MTSQKDHHDGFITLVVVAQSGTDAYPTWLLGIHRLIPFFIYVARNFIYGQTLVVRKHTIQAQSKVRGALGETHQLTKLSNFHHADTQTQILLKTRCMTMWLYVSLCQVYNLVYIGRDTESLNPITLSKLTISENNNNLYELLDSKHFIRLMMRPPCLVLNIQYLDLKYHLSRSKNKSM